MAKKSPTRQTSNHWNYRRWLWLLVMLLGLVALAVLAWPYLSFLTDRDELRRIILDSGPWAPLVFMFLQALQVVVAPIPGTVISLAGGYVFETFWATVYAMIGTTVGFLVVFTVSKRYGRRIIKYFVPADKVARYDEVASSKGAFAFLAVGFLFPFIPDPVLGYVAGTTPIPTRVLMVICIVMRLPGVLMTSLVGSQIGQGHYGIVGALLGALVVVLIIGSIYYQRISTVVDKLYQIALREQKEDQQYRRQVETISARRRQRRKRRLKKAVVRAKSSIKSHLDDG